MENLKNKKDVDLLWQKYESYVRKICEYKLQSMPDYIDDCVQDIFIDFYKAIENGKKIENPHAWLTCMSRNKINDIYKRNNKIKIVSFLDENTESFFELDDEIDRLNDEQLEEIKEKVLSKLSPKDRDLLEDRYTLHLSADEIATNNATTANNIYQRIFRLKIKVKSLIKQELES